ncbi:hypothetical protein NL676_020837 [Syzygium grande]|nr:hypothetical protein NL676_020837 [Syzygium grande]
MGGGVLDKKMPGPQMGVGAWPSLPSPKTWGLGSWQINGHANLQNRSSTKQSKRRLDMCQQTDAALRADAACRADPNFVHDLNVKGDQRSMEGGWPS